MAVELLTTKDYKDFKFQDGKVIIECTMPRNEHTDEYSNAFDEIAQERPQVNFGTVTMDYVKDEVELENVTMDPTYLFFENGCHYRTFQVNGSRLPPPRVKALLLAQIDEWP